MSKQIIEVIESSGVEATTQATLKERFLPFFEQAEKWRTIAATLVVTDESQTREMKMAREGRLALRAIRVEADKVRKYMKEESIRKNRAIQDAYNIIEWLIKPIEEHLKAQEDFPKIQEQKRLAALRAERMDALEPYLEYIDAEALDTIETAPEHIFQAIMTNVKQAKADAIAAAERAEAERIAREKAEAEERERIRKENERLRAEAAERERQMAVERAKAQAEKEKAEAEARKEREAIQAKLKAEQEARAAIEAEARKKAQDEAEELARKEEEARKLAAGPDKAKLQKFVVSITELLYSIPETNTAQGGKIAGIAQDALSDLANELQGYIDAM